MQSPVSRQKTYQSSEASPVNRRQRRLSILLPRNQQSPFIITGNTPTDLHLLQQEGYNDHLKYLLIEGDTLNDPHFRLEQVVDSLAGCDIPHRLKFGECSPQAIQFIINVLVEKNIQVQGLDLSGCLIADPQTMDLLLKFVEINSRSLNTLLIAKNNLLERHLQQVMDSGPFPFLKYLKIKSCVKEESLGASLSETVIRMIGLDNNLLQLSLAGNSIPLEAIQAILINFTGSRLQKLNLSENPCQREFHLDWDILEPFLENTPTLISLNFNSTNIGRYTFIKLLNYAGNYNHNPKLRLLLAKAFSPYHDERVELADVGDCIDLSPFNNRVIISVDDISDSFRVYLMELVQKNPRKVNELNLSFIQSQRISEFALLYPHISSEFGISTLSPLIYNFWLFSLYYQPIPFLKLKKVSITSMWLSSGVVIGVKALIQIAP